MRICSFSVKNYRSITKAYKVPLFDKSILIGPNNEGKSNVLRGLLLTLETLRQGVVRRVRYIRMGRLYDRGLSTYDWERDFPIPLQKTKINGSSIFTVELELNEKDKEDFRKNIKSYLSTNLILELNFFKDSIGFDVIIPGRAKKSFKNKYDLISEFLRRHINFQYIPAVRTANYAIDIVDDLLSRELALLEEDPEYQSLLENIKKKQKPILKSLATDLTKSISEFVPDVKSIELDTSKRLHRAIRQSCRMLLDDGVKTDLEQKGDGIKSLTAISLVKHLSKGSSKIRDLILAIEEPESHLHSKAIHRLGTVLNEISSKQQVIITTHSPLLVDRINISNNILVHKSKVQAAKNIAQIRDILGVQVSDNLTSASWVLLVEGEEDKIILNTWLTQLSAELKRAFEMGKIIIDDLQGGSNLSFKLAQYKNLLCNVFAFLDDDSCGRDSFEKAKSRGLIDYNEVVFSTCLGRSDSEIEDLIHPDIYIDAIKNKYGVFLQGPRFKNNRKKWSDRVYELFQLAGKPWNKKIEKDVKKFVAEIVAQSSSNSLHSKRSNSIRSLIKSLKEKLNLNKIS